MKKNVMMRIASVLLIAVLISTCGISGTYAKYVTSASSTDTARVAKWGVYVSATTDLFADTYATDDGAVSSVITNSVVSSNADLLVAPGTTKQDVAFTITGTPEVAVTVTVALDKNTGTAVKDVFLAAGTYTDYTKKDTNTDTYGTFTLTQDYYPLVWSLKNGAVEVATGQLSDIEAYLEATSGTKHISGNYAPNEELSTLDDGAGTGSYTLSWTWAFERADDPATPVNEKDLYNAADTLLGNLAVDASLTAKGGVALVAGTDYCLDVDYTLSITVEQID